WLVTKLLKRRVSLFRSQGFASREVVFNLLAAIVLFIILLYFARFSPGIGTHFFMMASSLLIEFSLLLAATLLSMLVRIPGKEIENGLKIYVPVLTLGLLVIAFRIIFIPNSLIALIFPPILLLFGYWQWKTYERDVASVPKADKTMARISLLVTVFTLALSLCGFSLMGLQLYIWWIFQLAVLQLIMAVKEVVRMYREKRVDKHVRAYRMKHPAEIAGNKEAYILVTWLYDLLDMVVIPVLILVSIPGCMLLASRVFDLTEIFRTVLSYPFLEVKAITLSLNKILLAIGLFLVFRYIEYLARSLYRVFKMRDSISKSKTGLLRENEVNLTLANNVIWLLTWGFFIIVAIGILKIPTKSLQVVAAGLAAGLGFAMKDILNNFFYGVQLMSGRMRVGDTIECDGIRGTVENISYQTTSIKAVDGSIIAFPNSTLFSKTFKNLTKSDSYEYIALPVGVAYGTDIDKARKVLLRALKPLCKPDKFGRDIVKSSYGIQVTLSGFGDSSVDLLIKQYVLVDQRYSYVARANEIIYKALADNEIEIPFPQRDVHIKNDSEIIEKK
ncbi:MAG: mechanosensitive ion channel, partial [Bacteroidales bacterium]|nr:mechanosensitive ion channel [Bacteroidales bacterium]